jgi:hypothetical protein
LAAIPCEIVFLGSMHVRVDLKGCFVADVNQGRTIYFPNIIGGHVSTAKIDVQKEGDIHN